MPDPSQLTQQLVSFLAPFLPYLLKVGEQAAEEAGKRLGADAWERAKALWGRLKRTERVRKAAETDLGQGLALTIAYALETDDALQADVAEMVQSQVVQRMLAETGSRIARDEPLSPDELVFHLGAQLRCALMQSSLKSLNGALMPGEVLALLRSGVWTPTRGHLPMFVRCRMSQTMTRALIR